MTHAPTRLNRSGIIFLCIASFILIADTLFARLVPNVESDRIWGYAVLFDFAVAVPFLYWLMVARRKGKSIFKVLPFFLAGALTAWFVLPVELRGLVWDAVWPVELLIVAGEIAFVFYEARLVIRFVRRFGQTRRLEPDIGEALRQAVKDEFGDSKLAAFFLHDLCMLYYALFSWKRKAADGLTGRIAFTYHRKNPPYLYAGIITHILVFEAVVVHLMVQQWSHLAAWLLTAADIWLLVFVWADCRASTLKPVLLDDGMLRIRFGLRLQADVPLDAIAAVASAREYEPDSAEMKRFAGPIVGAPNVRIELNCPITVDTLLFMPRSVTGIYLTLDEPRQFVREVDSLRR